MVLAETLPESAGTWIAGRRKGRIAILFSTLPYTAHTHPTGKGARAATVLEAVADMRNKVNENLSSLVSLTNEREK